MGGTAHANPTQRMLPHSLIMVKNRKNLSFLSGYGEALPRLAGPINVSVDLKNDFLRFEYLCTAYPLE